MSSVNGAISWPSMPHSREITVVEIRNPFTHQKRNGKRFTDFEICVKSNSKAFTLSRSSVRRRYSDFVWLRDWLRENNEGFSSIRKTPSLPPKKILGRFEDEFIEERMKGLQRFLRKVIEHNVFLSDKALHLFLQSNMDVKQIESYLIGKPVELNIGDCADHELYNENRNDLQSKNVAEAFDSKVAEGSIASNKTPLHKIKEDSTSINPNYINKKPEEITAENNPNEQASYVYESFESIPQNNSSRENQPKVSVFENSQNNLIDCENDGKEQGTNSVDNGNEIEIKDEKRTTIDEQKLSSYESDCSISSLDDLFDDPQEENAEAVKC